MGPRREVGALHIFVGVSCLKSLQGKAQGDTLERREKDERGVQGWAW